MFNSDVKRHYCCYWTDFNPHWMKENRKQHHTKLNLWACIVNGHVVGSFFIEDNLTSENYKNMFLNLIVPTIQNINRLDIHNLWFQDDGVPPHYSFTVRNLLKHAFTQQWLGRKGAIEMAHKVTRSHAT